MKIKKLFVTILVLLGATQISIADDIKSSEEDVLCGIWERETLTNDLFGLNTALADSGIEMALSTTQIYQQNVRGGTSTHRGAGRFSGSYELELEADLEKLIGVEGGNLYILTEGSYSDGIDAPSVGSFFGVNGDAGGNRSIDVTELWYEQAMLEGSLRVRFGKLNLTGGFEHHNCPVSFDCSSYANDEAVQFLNGALVNNPSIPFPENGLGIAVHYSSTRLWYVSAAVADAQADARETGFKTTFQDEAYFFYIFETGITPQLSSDNGPLQGAYRAGLWYDPQPKAHSDSSENYRDDVGFYVTCDQMLIKENDDTEDNQGLGGFFRFGYADSKKNDLANFWSIGFQYHGLLDDRDDDVIGLGFAQGFFSDYASTTYTDDYESALELYYNIQVTPWLNVSPSIQYIANPGGDETVRDAVVLGVRAQMSF
jgi:porin